MSPTPVLPTLASTSPERQTENEPGRSWEHWRILRLNLQVTVLDVDQLALQEDDVVVMATDGLWDVLSNEQVALLVRSFLTGNLKDDPHRYCS